MCSSLVPEKARERATRVIIKAIKTLKLNPLPSTNSTSIPTHCNTQIKTNKNAQLFEYDPAGE